MRRRTTNESAQATLGQGGFTRVAASKRASGEALFATITIGKGMKVLFLGCDVQRSLQWAGELARDW